LNGAARKGKFGFSLGGFGRAGYNINGRFENEQIAETTQTVAHQKSCISRYRAKRLIWQI